jgi:quercetin dioxygenase-like cupin family protein
MTAQPVWFLSHLAFVHLRGEDTNGELGVVELWSEPGDQAPTHRHNEADEGFYVLEGEVTLLLPDRDVVLKKGDFFLAPKGVPHTFRVTSDVQARWLNTSTPAGMDGFIDDFSSPAAELRPPDPSPPDVEKLLTVASKYHIDVLGPPGLTPRELAAQA